MGGDMLVERLVGLGLGIEARDKADRPAVRVPREQLAAVAERLRQDPELAFDLLLDHTGIDWLAEARFELVYNLYSTQHGHYLTLTVLVPRDDPTVPTVSHVWPIAQWQEREVYDLLGVLYDDHPDLRRLFLEDGWQGFPLRKDYQDDDMLELPK
ncbi:MAG: NADH-quinone oxidoreductase subunit C [Candidatus Latescibacterota bacterium]